MATMKRNSLAVIVLVSFGMGAWAACIARRTWPGGVKSMGAVTGGPVAPMTFVYGQVDDAVVAKLRRPQGQIVFDGETVSDAVDRLRDVSQTNIFVNWTALETAGIRSSLPVTARLRGPLFADVLVQFLQEVGGNGVRLGYIIDANVIVVSTAEDLNRAVYTRVYDVRPLLPSTDRRGEEVKALIHRVEGIDPLSWKDNGGRLGTVRELGGHFIIVNTPDVHDRLAAYFASRGATAATPAPTFASWPQGLTTRPVFR